MTDTAAATIPSVAGTCPPGRSPTICFSTLISFGLPHRSFSSTTARSIASRTAASSAVRAARSAERRSTSIQASNGIEFTEVPPPMRPTLNVVRGWLGT